MKKRILKHEIFEEANAELLERFWQYHRKNPWVYSEFRRYAHEMAQIRDKYGAWSIIQKIRWDYDVTTRGDVFKINNDFVALYARLLIAEYPSFEGFFELRRMKTFNRMRSSDERYRRSTA